MVTFLKTITTSALILALWAAPALALEPLELRGTYRAYFNGIPFAKLWMAVEKVEKDGYKLTATIKSRGLLNIFSPMKHYITADGSYTDAYVLPRYYYYKDESGDPLKTTALTFDETGKLGMFAISPPEDPGHRPPLSGAFIKGAVDPLALYLAIRRNLSDHLKQNIKEGLIMVVDGKRLYGVEYEVKTIQKTAVGSAPAGLIPVTGKRSPVYGFTEKELRRMEEGEPEVTFYFDPKQLIPLYIESTLRAGKLAIYFEPESPVSPN